MKRAERNRTIKAYARTAAKIAAETIASSDEAKAREQLRRAIKVLDAEASAGALHRNTARRKVARLSAGFYRKFGKTA